MTEQSDYETGLNKEQERQIRQQIDSDIRNEQITHSGFCFCYMWETQGMMMPGGSNIFKPASF